MVGVPSLHVHAQRVQGLDMLRGVAVGLVMLRHAWPSAFGGAGIVGVTIFFALSGYLITGILDREIDRRGTVRFGRFYRNRALRLFPALVGLLVVYAVVELTLNPLGDSPAMVFKSVAIGVLYVGNLPFDFSIALGHLWSLATEEQFYLVWPAFLLFGRRMMKPLYLCMIAAVGLTATCWISLTVFSEPADVYILPTTWGSALALGGVGYYLQPEIRQRLSVRGTFSAAATGLILLASMSIFPGAKNSMYTYLFWPTLIAVSTIAVIYLVVQWQTLPFQVLKPLLWLGTISYGAYLWNLPIQIWIDESLGDGGPFGVLAIPCTIVAATVSWWTVELIGRRARARLDSKKAPALRD